MSEVRPVSGNLYARRLGGAFALAAIGLLAAVAYFAGGGAPALRLAFKPVPVLALAAWVAMRSTRLDGRLVAAGLVASAAGDALLEWGTFLPGLVAFLCAHLVYIAAFVAGERRLALPRLLPFAAWGVASFGHLRAGLGSLVVPVAGYVAVITTMMWRAAARVGSPNVPRKAALLGLAGALSFGASDTLLAVNRFVDPVPGAGWLVIVLYWLGQWGIAGSVVVAAARAELR
jgi:uncharacterized membrane protein YhhN